MAEQRLYIWLDRNPFSGPPDLWIEDITGHSDLDLLAQAIRAGRLGRYLPVRLALSPHPDPKFPSGYRSVNVANLLRHYRIPYRTRLELVLDTTGTLSPGGREAADSTPRPMRRQ